MTVLKYFQQYQSHDRAFTLIEILITIFISTAVLGVLYISFFKVVDSRERVEQELDIIHESRVIFNRIRSDLANAFPRGNVAPVARDIIYPFFIGTVEGGNSAMMFTALTRDPLPGTRESDQSEIRYFVVEIQGTDLLALIRSENPWFGNQEGGIAYPISESVVHFELNFITEGFLMAENPEPILEWNATELGAYPRAVQVTVTLRDHNGENRTFSSMMNIPMSRGR